MNHLKSYENYNIKDQNFVGDVLVRFVDSGELKEYEIFSSRNKLMIELSFADGIFGDKKLVLIDKIVNTLRKKYENVLTFFNSKYEHTYYLNYDIWITDETPDFDYDISTTEIINEVVNEIIDDENVELLNKETGWLDPKKHGFRIKNKNGGYVMMYEASGRTLKISNNIVRKLVKYSLDSKDIRDILTDRVSKKFNVDVVKYETF